MNQPNLKKNYIYRILYEVVTLITPLITMPYVSRILGSDGIGVYSYTNSIIAYFIIFSALGTVSYGTREIARNRDDKGKVSILFWEIELLTIFTTLVCLFLWCIFISLSKENRLYYLALTPLLLSTIFDISWLFMGIEDVKKITVRNIICKIIGVVLLFLFINDKQDLILYISINSSIQLLGNLSMWIYLPGILKRIDFRSLNIKKHFHSTIVYFIPTIATSIYQILDKTLIGLITADYNQNGYYEQAEKIISVCKIITYSALNSTMTARMSYLFQKNFYGEIKRRIELSLNYILLIGCGCMFGLFAVASDFVPTFLGDGFKPLIKVLYFMSPLIIIIGISNCVGTHYHGPIGKMKQASCFLVTGAIVNLILNSFLIKVYGMIGATVSSVIAEFIILVLFINSSDSFFSWKYVFRTIWKKCIAGGIMLAAIRFLASSVKMPAVYLVIAEIISGCLIYGITLILLKDKSINELLEIIAKYCISVMKKSKY